MTKSLQALALLEKKQTFFCDQWTAKMPKFEKQRPSWVVFIHFFRKKQKKLNQHRHSLKKSASLSHIYIQRFFWQPKSILCLCLFHGFLVSFCWGKYIHPQLPVRVIFRTMVPPECEGIPSGDEGNAHSLRVFFVALNSTAFHIQTNKTSAKELFVSLNLLSFFPKYKWWQKWWQKNNQHILCHTIGEDRGHYVPR